ncbi:MAG: CAP domain-containing protein [Treponema sp.]|nr:CAP domain-containing protein [Treponema sp.]
MKYKDNFKESCKNLGTVFSRITLSKTVSKGFFLSKRCFLLCLLIMFFLPLSCNQGTVSGDMSTEELEVLAELNFARMQPSEYVKKRLETMNGTSTARTELINELKVMSPLPALKPGAGLTKAAREWVVKQGATSATGHGSGSDSMGNRIARYGNCSGAGENIAYGSKGAVAIIKALLIDENVSGRGHRKNILSKNYTHVGIAIGSHKGYGTMCVQDFATDYRDK